MIKTKQYRFVKENRADGSALYETEEKCTYPSGTVFWSYVAGSMSANEAEAQTIYKNLLDGVIVGKIILHGEQDV